MGRNSASPDHLSSGDNKAKSNSGGLGFNSIRDRFRFKRNPNVAKSASASDRHYRATRSHHLARSMPRKLLVFPSRGRSLFYLLILFALFAFALASVVLQSSITSVFRQGSERSMREGFKFGSSLRFVPWRLRRRFELQGRMDHLRRQPRLGVRPPRLGLILGNMKKDPLSLVLSTVVKNLQGLGYTLKIYAIEDGEARSMWEKIGVQVSILSLERYGHIDWSLFEGIMVDSVEAKDAILSLMQEPFCSVPLIWIIQEDTLANRLPIYLDNGWDHLISHWRDVFSRADVVVFPDFSLPMLYSVLDTGNFFVVPGSPIDVWSAESYSKTHSRPLLRKDTEIGKDDMVVAIVGTSFFLNELSWDYAVAMHVLGPLLVKYARGEDVRGSFKFDVATHLGLLRDSVRHYGLNEDVNGLLLMTDIVLYASSQDDQGFPPLLTRAMSFGIPVIAPDYPIIERYVVDGVHGIIFPKHKPEALMTAFSLLISEGKLSNFAHSVSTSGRLLAKNMLAAECITGYARLLENVLAFPSEVLLPGQISRLNQGQWEWNLFQKEIEVKSADILKDAHLRDLGVVYDLEEDNTSPVLVIDNPQNKTENLTKDIPTEQDWDILKEIESTEEFERLEIEEIEERMEKNYGIWDELYHNARKAEKVKFETNERDEGELERTGQPLCIYEIYNGAGAWPFLHHGSLYRGLSLSKRGRRLKSDDVDAVDRLPLLNDTYYGDILCEIGGIFSIANRVDNIHRRPWIGFQSWRAEGKKMYALPSHVEALPPMPEDGGHWSALHSWVMSTPSFLEFMMFTRMFADTLDALRMNSTNTTDCLLGLSKDEKKHCYCRVLELLVNVWAYHSARKMLYIDPHSGSVVEHHPVEQRKGYMWTKYFNSTLLKSMDEDLAEAADDGDYPYERWLWPLTGEVYWQGVYEREREERYRLKMDKKRKTKEKLLERLRNGYKQKTLSG
ncbi:hypothetical protein RJ639_007556 [Escallonia herrerae]|uniref:Glycosyl transferase family 1 domain-containing protein n=1 Tax=Escallonia herrerae TaxID=1293975 RepID=A0AA88VUN8_9ASTE|nr:hypothetical protein RJ639_007556 [Escallonia herrerae]